MDDSLKQEVERLWNICFHDSSDFVRLYFDNVYKDEYVKCMREDGKMVSALQELPYRFRFYGNDLSLGYLSGVSTEPKSQNQGYMSRLLSDVLVHSAFDVSCLLPAEDWLYGYYGKFGFAPVVCCRRVLEALPNVNGKENKAWDKHEAYLFYRRMAELRTCGILHDWDDFKVIVEDNRQSKGKMVVASDGKAVVGIAFCYLEDAELVVKECLFEQNYRQLLLQEVANAFPSHRKALVAHFDGGDSFGMIRILNVYRILDLLARAYPQFSMAISLKDRLIKRNEGLYKMENGRVAIMRESEKQADVALDIKDFTAFVFGGIDGKVSPQFPVINLMLE